MLVYRLDIIQSRLSLDRTTTWKRTNTAGPTRFHLQSHINDKKVKLIPARTARTESHRRNYLLRCPPAQIVVAPLHYLQLQAAAD